MERLKQTILFSFQTKVLMPVFGVMVVLLAVCMWLVNQHVTRQLQDDAARRLTLEDAWFKNSQDNRNADLLLGYKGVVEGNNSSFNGLAAWFGPENETLTPDQERTVSRVFNDLISRGVADVILLVSDNAHMQPVTRDARFNFDKFEKDCTAVVDLAAQGKLKQDIVQNGDRLFDIFSIPLRRGDDIVAAVVFGKEDFTVEKFKKLNPDDELVLFSDGRVVATTPALSKPGMQRQLVEQFTGAMASGNDANLNPTAEFSFNNEHYRSLAGRLSAKDDPHQVGYLLVSSYEKSLLQLADTQRRIIVISTLAILLGTAVVWFLVYKVMQPLRELRDSAEAVGRGDFSQRVEVRSNDECGELAFVFNHMTENLQGSHAELKKTVETLKSTQSQLVQSEKLAGIGEFVAGVAHELNNPLTSVMGFSELLKMSDEDPQRKRHLEMIHKSAVRCQKIVQNLLSFARHHQPERKLVCVNTLVEAAVEILQYQLRTSNIQVITELDPNLPQAMVDPHQIQQVFVNIINNARQAIEEFRPKGWIRVRTEVSGVNVRVTFRDNGPGISDENKSKIFDPFFTTKVPGKGTGLGLSLCYGIVKEHGGLIEVRSQYSDGALFIIDLPIAADTDKTPKDKSNTSKFSKANIHEGAGKKILVIDDEELILQMVSETLGQCGYQVDVAADGETALNRLRQRNYDLALCDWKMPGLNGEQVYERLRTMNPEMSERMIFITGDVVNEHTQEFLQENHKVCLNKPFSLKEFRSAINTALAKRGVA